MTQEQATHDQHLKQTLQEFYEELDRKWEQAEDFLIAYRVPAAVSVRIKTVEPGEAEKTFLTVCHHDLGFVKHYGKWGICYGLSSDGTPGSLYWMSIHHCSAEQRVEAVAHFPALLNEVMQAAENYAGTVQDAVKLLDEVLKNNFAFDQQPPAETEPDPAPSAETPDDPKPNSEPEPPTDQEPSADAEDSDQQAA